MPAFPVMQLFREALRGVWDCRGLLLVLALPLALLPGIIVNYALPAAGIAGQGRLVASAASSACYLLFSLLSLGAFMAYARSQPVTLANASAAVAPRALSLMAVMMLSFIATFFGLRPFLFPALIVIVLTFCAPAACAFERLTAIGAFARAVRLGSGYWLSIVQMVGLLILVGLAGVMLMAVVLTPLVPPDIRPEQLLAAPPLAFAVAGGIAAGIMVPLSSAVAMRTYLHLVLLQDGEPALTRLIRGAD